MIFNLENRNCCTSLCTVPPETVKLTIDITPSGDYVFGDPTNFSWLDFLPINLDGENFCQVFQSEGTTAEATDLADFARKLTLKWLNENSTYFSTYLNETLVGGTERITVFIDRWRYKAQSGFDPCDGFKLQICSEFGEAEPVCYRKIKFTVVSAASGAPFSTCTVNIVLTCSFSSILFPLTIDNSLTTPVDVAINIEFVIGYTYPTWVVQRTGSELTIFIPCNESLICTCDPADYFAVAAVPPSLGGVVPTFFTDGDIQCENLSFGEGTPFDLDATLLIDVSCCSPCLNPFGYAHFQLQFAAGLAEVLQIQYNNCPSANPFIVNWTGSLNFVGDPFETTKVANALAIELNSGNYGDCFATTKGDVITIFFRNDSEFCDCENILLTYDNNLDAVGHQIIKEIDCCQVLGSGSQAVVQTISRDVFENIMCCNDYFIGINAVDCCTCLPLNLDTPCPYGDRIFAVFDFSEAKLGDAISLGFAEDGGNCGAIITPFEFDWLSGSLNSFLTNIANTATFSSSILSITAVGNTLEIDFAPGFGCCGLELFYNIYGSLATIAKISTVQCCANFDGTFDIQNAVVCWGVGKKYSPYLRFFQNFQIDPAQIPADCFALKIYTEDGQETFTECYEKVKCGSTLLFCSEYADGKTDCDGNIYGNPDEACIKEDCDFPKYNNCYRIYGELKYAGADLETENNINKATEKWQVITPLLPPYVVDKLVNIMNGKNLTINGKPMTFTGSINQPLENGKMFALNLTFDGKICVINHNCEQ